MWIVRPGQSQLREVGGGALGQRPGHPGQAAQIVVVEDQGFAVGR
jgi:hypothetical protein